jgi:hypothetical protein
MTIVKGAYTGTYNALAIGNTEMGFKLSYSYRGKSIIFDAVGGSPVDMLMDGLSMKVNFVGQEWDSAAVDDLRWPWGSIPGRLPVSGQSLWELAKPLFLDACSNLTVVQSILFPKAILAPDFNLDTDFTHLDRPLPMQLMIFPVKYEDGDPTYTTPLLPSGCEEVVYFVETL